MAAEQLRSVLAHVRKLAAPEPAAEQSDAQLLQHFAAGRDESAFADLLRRHGRLVWSVCRRSLPHREDAEDAFQATFLVLALKANAVRKARSLASWLHGTAYRCAMQIKRQSARRRHHEQRATPMPRPSTHCEASWQEVQAALDEELQRLPEKHRAPFVLCCLEGLSKAEAAAALGWKEGTVSGRLARARKQLQDRLARRGIMLSALLTASALSSEATAALAGTTLRAALLTAHQGVTAGCASAQAVMAAQGVTKAMFMTKAKLAVVLALSLLTVGLGAGAFRFEPSAAAPPAEETPNPPPPKEDKPARADRFGDPLPKGAAVRLGTVRFRHAGPVCSVAYSPDGKILATGSGHFENKIHLWEAATGKEIRQLTGHTGEVVSVAFSPDGKLLASAGECVRLWDVNTGKELRQLKTPNNEIRTVAFSPDGKVLAAVGVTVARGGPVPVGGARTPPPSAVYLWDVATGKELRQLRGHKGNILSAVISPDGKYLASGGEDHTIRLWEVATGKEVGQLRGHQNGVVTLAFSPDGKWLASSSGKPIIRLWETRTGKELRRFKTNGRGEWQGIDRLAFSPDGKILAAGGYHSPICFLDPITGKELHSCHDPGLNLFALAFSPDGSVLVSARASDHAPRFWDGATGKELPAPVGHQGNVFSLAFSPDGKRLATTNWNHTHALRLWEVATGKELLRFEGGIFTSVAFSPDGKLLAASGWDAKVRLWDAATGKELRCLKGHKRELWCVAFSPDGSLLASGGRDGTVRLWDAKTGKELRRLGGGDEPGVTDVFTVAFSPDGKLLASGNGSGTKQRGALHLWDVATGKELRQLPTLPRAVHAVAFSPDGRLLASWGGGHTTIQIWEVATGQEVRRLRGKQDCLEGATADGKYLAFSPKGRMLAVGSRTDSTLEIWDVATGQLLRRMPGHKGRIDPVAFSPDGQLLATGSTDTTVLIWNMADLLSDKRFPSVKLNQGDIGDLWATLADTNAAKADQAFWALAAAPKQAVPLLRKQLQPVRAADPRRVTKLIADLGHNRFAVRQKATEELEKMGEAAVSALRQAEARAASLEMRRRTQRLLEKLDNPIAPKPLRCGRAVRVLEHIGAPQARALLERLAGGANGIRLTQEAKAALKRLGDRPQK